MLLPAWVSIATVRLHLAAGADGRQFADSVADIDNAIPPDPAQNQHQKRDLGLHWGVLNRQFYQSMLVAPAAALDSGK